MSIRTRNELINAYNNGQRDFNRINLSGIDLSGTHLVGANFYRAVLCGVDFTSTNLAHTDLSGTDLSEANLRWTNLSGTDFRSADLMGADLKEVFLNHTNFGRAFLGDNQWVVQGATRSDGYQFYLTNFSKEGIRVKAGCRNYTIEAARNHWSTRRRPTDQLTLETWEILNSLWALAVHRGHVKPQREKE